MTRCRYARGEHPTSRRNARLKALSDAYLGIALLFLLGRNAPPSELRSAVCVGIGGASALLAALGRFELQARRVGTGIVVPSIVETALAAAFAWLWWRGR